MFNEVDSGSQPFSEVWITFKVYFRSVRPFTNPGYVCESALNFAKLGEGMLGMIFVGLALIQTILSTSPCFLATQRIAVFLHEPGTISTTFLIWCPYS